WKGLFRRRDKLVGSRRDLFRRRKAKRDAAGFSLVQYVGRLDLQCHWKSDLRRNLRGVCRRRRYLASRQSDAMCLESCVEAGGVECAGWRVGRGKRSFALTLGMEPQRVHGAERRL